MERVSKRQETTCPACGKTFSFYPSWPRKYCSIACASQSRQKKTRYVATCEVCSKQFETIPSQPGRFCSQACFGKWLSEHNRGPNNHNYGKSLPQPTDRVALVCPVCQGEFAVKRSHAKRRRFCSKLCQGAHQSIAMRGEANFAYNGGYEPYYGPSWREAMRAARQRDRVCQGCGKSPDELGRELDVHHIAPFKAFGLPRHEEANALANLISLCNVCHLLTEWRTNRQVRKNECQQHAEP